MDGRNRTTLISSVLFTIYIEWNRENGAGGLCFGAHHAVTNYQLPPAGKELLVCPANGTIFLRSLISFRYKIVRPMFPTFQRNFHVKITSFVAIKHEAS